MNLEQKLETLMSLAADDREGTPGNAVATLLPPRLRNASKAGALRPLNIRNARHAEDPRPLDPLSNCPATRDYSRAYLHHLVRSGEYLTFYDRWYREKGRA